MSKELEALQALKELKQNYKDNSHLFDDVLIDKIETEIKILGIIIFKRVSIELLDKCKDAAGYNQSIQHLPKCAFLRTEEFKAIKSLL
jgi:hypothetical protein